MNAIRSHRVAPRLEPAMIAGRVPPHDLDAEAAVLAAVLLSREALDRVLEILKPEHFYSDANGKIFEAAMNLAQLGTPIDIVSIGSWLRDREKLAQVGGASYLAQLADATPAVAHVGAHAAVVYEKWRLRHLIAVCQKVSAEGYGDVGIVQEFIDGAEQAIYAVARANNGQRETVRHVKDIAVDVFRTLRDSEGGMSGIPTGLAALDAKTAGLHEGDLSVIAARPGMGKTSLVLNMAVNIASPRELGPDDYAPGNGVIVFSLEMPEEQILNRMLCSEGRVDVGKLRSRMLSDDDWRALNGAGSYVSSLPIWIDDKSRTLLEIRAKVRRLQAEYNREDPDPRKRRRIGLVVVDYLQLMTGDRDAGNREQEISGISRGLKALAKECKVPVIVLSQLNRAVESRSKDKRPQLSDLRESGAIEKDADNVFFVYRDEYYNPGTTRAKGIAEIIIAKQRNGESAVTAYTRFVKSCTRFEDLAPGDYQANEA
jgi:replicative DNA helicase